MSKISLALKINLCLIILFLISLISSSVSLMAFTKSKGDTKEMAIISMPLADKLFTVQESELKMRINARIYSISGRESAYTLAAENEKNATKAGNDMLAIIDATNNKAYDDLRKEVVNALSIIKEFMDSMNIARQDMVQLEAFRLELLRKTTHSSEELNDYALEIQGWLRDMIMNDPKTHNISNMKVWVNQLTDLQQAVPANERAIASLGLLIAEKNPDRANDLAANAVPLLKYLADMRDRAFMEGMKKKFAGIHDVISECTVDAENIVNLIIKINKDLDERITIGDRLDESLAKIGDETVGDTLHMSEVIYKMIDTVTLLVIFCFVLLIVATVAIMLFIKSSVTTKLNNFVAVVGEFTSGEGDLSRRIPVTSQDELGILAQNFNNFVENVHKIIMSVKESADDVASGNNELAATMDQLSTTFNSQSEQVSSVAQNMSTLSDSAKIMVASLAGNITKMHDANESIKIGGGQLNNVLTNMDDIKNKTQKLNVTIDSLAESSGKIGDILGVINDIADQTNLLALNAAIEAARAGDAGRGFAVVADEVRKLAERTQRSTSEISAIISSLQKESSMASGEMKEAGTSVNSGLDSIKKTDASFGEVVSSVQEIDATTRDVNNNMSDQFTMIQSVSDNTNSIAAGIEESMHAVSEVASTVSHIQKRAEALKHMVSKFKV